MKRNAQEDMVRLSSGVVIGTRESITKDTMILKYLASWPSKAIAAWALVVLQRLSLLQLHPLLPNPEKHNTDAQLTISSSLPCHSSEPPLCHWQQQKNGSSRLIVAVP